MTLRKTADDHIPRPSPGSLGLVGARGSWAEGIACPRCEAPVGMRCVDTHGAKRSPHADRARAARTQGLAPARGRPREIEGEQRRIVLRAGTPEQAAIELYRELHPEATGDVPALRGILAEWLDEQEGRG